MSQQSETVTSIASAALGTDALQSFAMELMIFCATIAVALVLRALSFNSGCSAGFLNFWPKGRPPTTSKLQACSSPSHLQSTKESSPNAEPPRSMQAGGGRKVGARGPAQGPARVLETIMNMDRASNKSATEALSLYAELRSSDRNLQMQELFRSTRFSGLDFYSTLVQSAVRAGQPQVVEKLLDDMASGNIERTLSFYESVMKVLAGKKHYQQALGVYGRLTSEGFKASPVTLSCLVNFAAELGDLDKAIGFFEQLASTSTPSIRAYMVALRVYSKRQDWSKSMEIFRSMQSRGVPIDSLILNSVLATGIAAGKIEATEALLHEIAGSNPEIVDVISYNTVLKGYAHQKIADKALKILALMLERGLKPNGITFNTVMDAAVRGGLVEEAWTVLDKMQEAGVRADKFTCTILMKGLHEESTPKQLSKVIDMIQAALPQCDAALASSLFRGIIQVSARLNNTFLLMRAFNQMQGHNLTPTTTDYQIMIQTLAQQCDTEHCSTMWRHALAPVRVGGGSQPQPPTATAAAIFTSVMEELAKRDKVEGMICAFESLRTFLAAAQPEKHSAGSLGSQKTLEINAAQLLQQCRAALIQAASKKQHSSPACRRLLELAPEQGLSLEA